MMKTEVMVSCKEDGNFEGSKKQAVALRITRPI